MDMTTIWGVLAGLAIGLELLTGTFYLLMFALGLIVAALAAYLGFGLGVQLLVAALVSGGAVAAWRLKQLKPSERSVQTDSDVHLDIGSTVEVATWSSLGTARVMHRGAQWAARHSEKGSQEHDHFETGIYRIAAIEGNTLVLAKS